MRRTDSLHCLYETDRRAERDSQQMKTWRIANGVQNASLKAAIGGVNLLSKVKAVAFLEYWLHT